MRCQQFLCVGRVRAQSRIEGQICCRIGRSREEARHHFGKKHRGEGVRRQDGGDHLAGKAKVSATDLRAAALRHVCRVQQAHFCDLYSIYAEGGAVRHRRMLARRHRQSQIAWERGEDRRGIARAHKARGRGHGVDRRVVHQGVRKAGFGHEET